MEGWRQADSCPAGWTGEESFKEKLHYNLLQWAENSHLVYTQRQCPLEKPGKAWISPTGARGHTYNREHIIHFIQFYRSKGVPVNRASYHHSGHDRHDPWRSKTWVNLSIFISKVLCEMIIMAKQDIYQQLPTSRRESLPPYIGQPANNCSSRSSLP